MARISQTILNLYKLQGPYESCYFCGSPPTGFDTTPHHSAIKQAPDSMELVKVRVCTSCSQRIWYANVCLDNSSKREGAGKGLMTLEAKERLCSTKKWSRLRDENASFTIGEEGRMIVPKGYLRHEDGRIFVGPDEWTHEELMALQGPMALRALNLPNEVVQECFIAMIVADEATQCINPEKARRLLRL